MTQPVQNLHDLCEFNPLRQGWTVDHQNRQAKCAGRIQLGASTRTSCVLGHNQLRAMALHQRAVVGFGKRPSGHDHIGIGQGQIDRRIHQSQQVMMLWLGGKIPKMHPANGEKHALGRTGKRVDRSGHIGHLLPSVTGLRDPRRARQGRQRDLRFTARLNRIPAHPGRKGMGGIDHMRHPVVTDISGQTCDTAKPAHAHGQGLPARVLHTTRVRIDRRNPLFGHGFGQRIRLGRSAEYQEVRHV